MYPWLHLGPFTISTYSLMFLCAFIVGGIVTYYEAKRLDHATEAILRVALGALAGGLIGAKLSMLVFLGPATFIKDLPYLWHSGQAWTGAFFGGYFASDTRKVSTRGVTRPGQVHSSAAILRYSWSNALIISNAPQVMSSLSPYRWHRPLDESATCWVAIPLAYPAICPGLFMQQGVRRQPSALYELILDLLLFFLILRLRGKLPHSGDLFKVYVVGYCSLRFLLDFTRADPCTLGTDAGTGALRLDIYCVRLQLVALLPQKSAVKSGRGSANVRCAGWFCIGNCQAQ